VSVSATGETPRKHTSRIVRFGNPIFIGGTAGRHFITKEMPPDVAGQTRQALENIKICLEASGTSLGNVLKMTCYLADLADKNAFDNRITRSAAHHAFADQSLPDGRGRRACRFEVLCQVREAGPWTSMEIHQGAHLKDGIKRRPVPTHRRADGAHDHRYGLHDGMSAFLSTIRRTRRNALRSPPTLRSGLNHLTPRDAGQ